MLLLLPVWGILALIYYLAHSDHPLLPKLLRLLPLLKKYSEMQALADLSYALGTFIAVAGFIVVTIFQVFGSYLKVFEQF
ncbi:MAG: hypothetical protein ACNA77_03225 [Opitutales bacterium]